MMKVSEVIEWLQTLHPDQDVGIDDRGLSLVTLDNDGATQEWLEIGGTPLPGEAHEDSD